MSWKHNYATSASDVSPSDSLRLPQHDTTHIVPAVKAVPLSAPTPSDNRFVLKNIFLFEGYFRGSMIGTHNGKVLPSYFRIPGARSLWRMANEPDIYGQFNFTYNQKLNDGELDLAKSQYMEFNIMPAGYVAINDPTFFFLRNNWIIQQCYLKLHRVFNGATIWTGWQYYHRRGEYLLDYYWYNPGQDAVIGGGVEEIPGFLHNGNISVAIHYYQSKNVERLAVNPVTQAGILGSYTLDAKWHNIALSANSSVAVGAHLSIRPRHLELHYPTRTGWAVYAWWDFDKRTPYKTVTNTLQANYRTGTSFDQGTYTGQPVYETFQGLSGRGSLPNTKPGVIVEFDLLHCRYFEISNSFVFEREKKWSVNALVLLTFSDVGTIPYYLTTGLKAGPGHTIIATTAGFRAYYYCTRYFALSLDCGWDYYDNQTIDKRGSMLKVSFSPQVRSNYGFYSRPEFRPFVTVAVWSPELKGLGIGGKAFDEQTYGVITGIQVEGWW